LQIVRQKAVCGGGGDGDEEPFSVAPFGLATMATAAGCVAPFGLATTATFTFSSTTVGPAPGRFG